MCLYPKLIRNPKYKANKKNGGNVPPVSDERVLWVPIGCQQCIECRKEKARDWTTRLMEDIKVNKNGKMITLTFSNESIKKIHEMEPNKRWPGVQHLEGYEYDNEIAIHAVRLFTERWRKKFDKTIRHFLVTELGHNGTENIHLHGIVWTDENFDTIRDIWQYGWIWPRKETTQRNYVNEKTVNYTVKYITKIDEDHKYYKPEILVSKGIGRNYVDDYNSKRNKFNEEKTKETYLTRTGHEMSLPIYYRNKIYSEEEREKLWLQKLDKNERWIMGEKIDISKGDEGYYRSLEHYRKHNKRLGYGDGEKDWNREQYEIARRNILNAKRLEQKKHVFLEGESSTNEINNITNKNKKNNNNNNKT